MSNRRVIGTHDRQQQPKGGKTHMTKKQKTIIVTGASQGIGAAVANCSSIAANNVVGNSRKISHKTSCSARTSWPLVDGDIGLARPRDDRWYAVKGFGSVDALVNNRGDFLCEAVHEYTPEDFRCCRRPIWMALSIRRNCGKQMLSQKSGAVW